MTQDLISSGCPVIDRQMASGRTARAYGIRSTSYRAKILVLHLLELSISVAGAQFHISQNHLEYSVVDGLGEVHVQLVHSSLQTKPKRPLGKGSCQKGVQRYQSGCVNWRQQGNLQPTGFFKGKKNVFVMFQTELYLSRSRPWRKMKNSGFKGKRNLSFCSLSVIHTLERTSVYN